jgi:nucleoporin GLE1
VSETTQATLRTWREQCLEADLSVLQAITDVAANQREINHLIAKRQEEDLAYIEHQQAQLREQRERQAVHFDRELEAILALAQAEEEKRQRELEAQRQRELEEARRKQAALEEAKRQAEEAKRQAEEERKQREAAEAKAAEDAAAASAARQLVDEKQRESKVRADAVVSHSAIGQASQRMQALLAARGAAERFQQNPNFPSKIRVKAKIKIGNAVQKVSSTIASIRSSLSQVTQFLSAARQQPNMRDYYFFMLELLASKLVVKGDEHIARHPGSAFAFGTFAAHVAANFPEFTDIFVASINEKCPYTIPRYYTLAQCKGSKAEFKLRLGFKRIGDTKQNAAGTGVITFESDDEYLERMSGVTRLFAAFTTADVKNHPYGIGEAWMWLARILNQKPKNATATVLHAFLQIAGFKMLQTYRNQFAKLLYFIHSTFLPLLAKKSETQRASRTRVELYIESFMRSQRINEPDGFRLAAQQQSSTQREVINQEDYKKQ